MIKGTVASGRPHPSGRAMMRQPFLRSSCAPGMQARRRPHQGHHLRTGRAANQLVGYGLVIGLNGTGDSLRNSPFTAAVAAIDAGPHGHQRAQCQHADARTSRPSSSRPICRHSGKGSRIDVTVSSLGDATSLAAAR